MASDSEGEGEAERNIGCGVAARCEFIAELEKSTSEPEREALLRCRRRVSVLEEMSKVVSLERKPRPDERMDMLEDFVRLGRWNNGLVEEEGRGGGAERGVSKGDGEAARRLAPG